MKVETITRSDITFGQLSCGDVFCLSPSMKDCPEETLVKITKKEAMFLSDGDKVNMNAAEVVVKATEVNVEVVW